MSNEMHLPGATRTIVANPSQWSRLLQTQLDLWRFCARRLHENNVTAMSAALSFRTIFALIPLLVLSFLVLRELDVVEDAKRSLREFLDTTGIARFETSQEVPSGANGADEASTGGLVPETTPAEAAAAVAEKRVYNVADEIVRIVDGVEQQVNAKSVGPIGIAMLIWTALSLLTTVEISLNRIFGAPQNRALGRRIAIYWSVTTLGPVLLAIISILGHTAVEAVQDIPLFGSLLAALSKLGPITVGILVIAAIYKFMPNTRVPYKAAVGGAVVFVVVWLFARWAFLLYVEYFVKSGNIYGVLGLFPLFLLWLNLSWMLFLFGAELAHTGVNLRRLRLSDQEQHMLTGPSHVIAAITAVGQRFQNGTGPLAFSTLADLLNLPVERIEPLMDRLVRAGLVSAIEHRDEEGVAYTLARPPERIPMQTIYDATDPRDQIDGALATIVEENRARVHDAYDGQTLANLLEEDGAPGSAG